jgi:hypothetical protein
MNLEDTVRLIRGWRKLYGKIRRAELHANYPMAHFGLYVDGRDLVLIAPSEGELLVALDRLEEEGLHEICVWW